MEYSVAVRGIEQFEFWISRFIFKINSLNLVCVYFIIILREQCLRLLI